MKLFRLLSWQYVRKHKLRSVLTLSGITLGVAIFVGMHTVNQSVLSAFQHTVDRVAGATELEISAGEPGFEEEVLERVQAEPCVSAAAPIIEAIVDTGSPGQGSLLVLAVDMTGDRSLREYDLESGESAIIDDPLVFLAQPDSIMVSRQFAQRNGLRIGSGLALETMEGPKRFTVRGIMRTGGLASAYGGSLAVMDIYAAQLVFGRGRRFDRIDVGADAGIGPEKCRERLEALLGPGFKVEPPSARGQYFASMSQAFAISISFASVFALLIGIFIIYNSFSIAVSHRRAEIGILRSMGATRGQIRNLFLAESAVAGVIGSAIGVGAGILLARGMITYTSTYLRDLYGTAQRAETVTTDPPLMLCGWFMGLLASLAGGWLPARSASRVDPVKALQKGKYQLLSAGENRARRLAAFALGCISAACLLLSSSPWAFYTGYVLAVLAALLLSPALALWLARALRPVLRWLRPVEGALAADSLIQAPRRTSATVAALMLSLALAVGFAGVARASYRSIHGWIDVALNPDLFVTASPRITARSFRFEPEVETRLRAVAGVREVQAVRTPRVLLGDTPVLLVAVDIGRLIRTSRREPLEGDGDTAYRLAAEGKGAIISDNLALLRGLKKGDTIELAAPLGVLRLPVLGSLVEYSDQQGSILIDRSLYTRYWGDTSVNTFRVYLEPGAAEAAVRQSILEGFAGERRVFVLTNREVRSYILDLTDQWFGLTYVQLAVAVLVAILGIVNTLTVSIIDRRRELGVLQAVGAVRRQIRNTIWLEAVSIGVVGLLLGLALGALNLYFSVEMVRQDIAGIRLTYAYPWLTAAVLIPVILGAAWLSALGPAESAVRGSLSEALEYE